MEDGLEVSVDGEAPTTGSASLVASANLGTGGGLHVSMDMIVAPRPRGELEVFVRRGGRWQSEGCFFVFRTHESDEEI